MPLRPVAPPLAGLALAALLGAFAAPAAAQVNAGRPSVAPSPVAVPVQAARSPAAQAAFDAMKAACAPKARFQGRLAMGLGLRVAGDTPRARAATFLSRFGGIFDLGAHGRLVAGEVQGRSVRLVQLQGDTEVRGAGVTLVFDLVGRLKGYTDETVSVASAAAPRIDAAKAIGVALAHVSQHEGVKPPETRLVFSARGGVAVPVYEVTVVVRPPLDIRRVLVDATNGNVVGLEALAPVEVRK